MALLCGICAAGSSELRDVVVDVGLAHEFDIVRESCWQVEWHSGTKRQRQEFWTDVVHNACQSLLHDEETQGEEEFRRHLRRLTRENNIPRKRQVRTYRFVSCKWRRHNETLVGGYAKLEVFVSCSPLVWFARRENPRARWSNRKDGRAHKHECAIFPPCPVQE